MIDIRFGPQVCGDLTSAATREWLVPTASAATPWAPSAGCGPAATTACWWWPARRRRPAGWGWSASTRRSTLPSGGRVRLGAHEWASGDVDPRGFELLERFDLVDGLPRWRWRIGDVVIERELAMVHGRSCVAVVHRLVAGGPVRLDAGGASAPGGTRTASGAPTARRPGWSRSPTARWSRARTGSPARAGRRTGSGGWACTTARRPPAAAPGRGPLVRRPLRRRAGRARATRWRCAPGPATWPTSRRRRPQIVAAARRRNRAVVAAAKPADAVEATLALAADAFVVRTADRRRTWSPATRGSAPGRGTR